MTECSRRNQNAYWILLMILSFVPTTIFLVWILSCTAILLILFSLTFATVVCGIVVLAGFIYVPILICCIVSALTCSLVYNFVLFFHDWMWTLSAK
ncbi:hypothetical protein MVEG_10816 [Podila verticillata NRRL 6337]|nr:hypothetical protein MVEG_10816 [Podila verticillata NRRL 6337]